MERIRRERRLGTTSLRLQARPLADALERRCLLSTSFAAPTQFAGVVDVTGIAAGDFNGDGQTDIAVAGDSPSAQVPVVGVYLNSNGNLGTPTLFPFTGTAGGVGVGDLNGDGKADIAVVDSSTNTLNVFLGDGSGNFTPGAGIALGGTPGDAGIVVADFDGDGNADVAVVDPADEQVVVAISSGNGAFSIGSTIAVPNPTAIVSADFNGDGNPDLAIASGDGQVYVALNDGAGNFTTATPYSASPSINSLSSLAVADFNGDGSPDLAALGSTPIGPMAGVLLNSGAGSFTSNATLAVPNSAAGILTGQFAQSGNQDIAVIGSDGSLGILAGDGTGQFASNLSVLSTELGSPLGQAVTADFNGDLLPDIAYLSSSGGFGVTDNTTGETMPVVSNLSPTIARSTLPAQVIAGTAVHGKAFITVSNASATAVTGSVTVSLYASSDGAVDGNSILLGSIKKPKITIKANNVATFVVPENVAKSIDAGSYTLFAQSLDPSGIANTATTGPTLTVSAPFIALAESFVKLPLPPAVVSGTKTAAKATIQITNGGNITSGGLTTIALYASPDGFLSDATLIKSISKGLMIRDTKPLNASIPLGTYPNVADGDYFIIAQVTDPKGNTTTVVSTTTINIAAAKIDLGGVIASIPATGKIGKTISVTLNVTNTGNTLAKGSLAVAFAVSPNADGSDSFAVGTVATHISLKPGVPAKLHFKVPLPFGVSAGNAFLVAALDPADIFADVNLSNNMLISGVTISLV